MTPLHTTKGFTKLSVSITIVSSIILIGVGIFFMWQPLRMSSSTPIIPPTNDTQTQADVAVAPPHNNPTTPTDIVLQPTTVTLADGSTATFELAAPFTLTIAAEGLGKARFIARSPDGRIFVPDLVNYRLSHEGSIQILDDFDETTGRFATTHTYLSGLRGPNSVAFYTDADGQDWIYIALTAHLVRYPYTAGDTAPSGEGQIVTTFPNKQSPGQTSVVWHITRTLHFHEDTLYISVGSGCNACEELVGDMRAMIIAMNPDGTNERMYANGLRNAVGMTWANDALYATDNGVDHLGRHAPDEMLYRIEEGKHYGWPYCYESNGSIRNDTSQKWNTPYSCDKAPRTLAAFEPHSAPLGVTYFKDAHEALDNSFLVALHGSFDKEVGAGYQIMRVTKDGAQTVFMRGFQDDEKNRLARPVHFLQHDYDSFFFTDDHGERLYYVSAR